MFSNFRIGPVIYLLIGLLAICAGLVLLSGKIADSLVRNLLAQTDIHLKVLEMGDFRGWPYPIHQVILETESLDLLAKNIAILPSSLGIYSVEIASLVVTRRPVPNEKSAAPSWQQVIKLVDENIAFLPASGQITKLQLCWETCIGGAVRWIRNSDGVKVTFDGPDNTGSVEWRGRKLHIESFGFIQKDVLASIELSVSPSDKLEIESRSMFLSTDGEQRLPIHEASKAILSVKKLSIESHGTLPLDALIDPAVIWQGFEGNIEIQADASFQASFGDSLLSSQNPLAARINLHSGRMEVSLDEPVVIAVVHPRVGEASIIIGAHQPCQLDAVLSVSCTGEQIHITAQIDNIDVTASLSDTHIEPSGEYIALQTAVDLTITEGDNKLLYTTFNLHLSEGEINAVIEDARIFNLEPVNGLLHHNLITGKGKLTAGYSGSALPLNDNKEYAVPVEILSGHVELETSFSWGEAISFESSVSLYDIAMVVDDYQFVGGSFNANLKGWPLVQTTTPARMNWQHIDIGTPLQKIELEFDMRIGPNVARLTGTRLKTELLGGYATSTAYHYNFLNNSGYLLIELHDLELSELLDLEEQNLQSGGRIIGSVPIHIDKGRVTIRDGNVTSIEPGGYIRYNPTEGLSDAMAGNSYLGVVTEVLKDFRFRQLDSTFQYSEDGNLTSNTQLKGNNPNFENGREIHLNISLEDNIDILLKSLRTQSKLTERIEKASKEVLK